MPPEIGIDYRLKSDDEDHDQDDED